MGLIKVLKIISSRQLDERHLRYCREGKESSDGEFKTEYHMGEGSPTVDIRDFRHGPSGKVMRGVTYVYNLDGMLAYKHVLVTENDTIARSYSVKYDPPGRFWGKVVRGSKWMAPRP